MKKISQVAGEIYSNMNINQFALIFIENGIRAELCDSSQREGGAYIRVEEGATEFIVEVIAGEYIVTGNASSCARMYQTARQVSSILTTLDIAHVFEVYNESIEIAHYLHHNCPQ
jgi:hypothetical protein